MHLDHSELDRRTVLRAGLGAAAVAVVGSELAFPTAARAASASDLDWIISCDEWGARPPKDPLSVSAIPTNKIIVHHMAFPNVTDYSREQAIKLARDCQNLHMDGNGWSDTGQHFTVSRGGYVTEGRRGSLERLTAGDRQMISAHCPGENGRAIGIENEGTYVSETPPQALLDSLVRLCTTICRQYGLHAHDIFGHWDFRNTLCPGAAFYAQFPTLRRRVFTELGTDLADVPARRWPDLWRFVSSPSVRVVQYLLTHRGYTPRRPSRTCSGCTACRRTARSTRAPGARWSAGSSASRSRRTERDRDRNRRRRVAPAPPPGRPRRTSRPA
ncbi:hypothetical protein GCM10010429_31950 [Micromonospora olivasterospora]|uniref:N-acetylmuramoyl-L-alanine amidase n=1 Tax=Micromonospora olivasterospora TaxID=1880 RepID=A0A562IH84_MICOL|nr:N-acetylmuramoyl-L-alanine amidase [Micromonospora olivasterospora]